MVRAYVPAPGSKHSNQASNRPQPASDWALIFDTETRTDPGQALRFGAYQLRRRDRLVEIGLFYEPDNISAREFLELMGVAKDRGAKLMTRDCFVEEVFFERAYELRATIIGFNLPFDLSRLAIRHASARGKTMKGGFTFALSRHRWRPNVQVRHLNSRAALIQFAAAPRQFTPRGMRRKGMKVPTRRGSFVDLKTAAAALHSRSFSLQSLADFLKTETHKREGAKHGEQLTEQYVEYALQDVQASWECYRRLRADFERHGLTKIHLGKVLSEASLGKAYLREMGIRPFREMQPDFPDALTGKIISTYYGGRCETHLRRAVCQVLYCDFLSMYPTVCTLMGLWQFVIAQGVTWQDSTTETSTFLKSVQATDLQDPEIWKKLHTIVRLRPEKDILPLRARYDGKTPNIGVNIISSDVDLWYTLADVIVSKLLTGKTPVISEAITFYPQEPQAHLRSFNIAKNAEYAIDPRIDDFYKRLIDLRAEVKLELKGAPAHERDALEAKQQTLKILANSTSYGIFVEVNVSDFDKAEQRTCFGPSETSFEVETIKSEEPGPYFHPLLASLITGAARLMLGLAEHRAQTAGIDWAYCDTDSMAFTKRGGMDWDDFTAKAKSVCDWFGPLNPFEKKGPLFKIENANYALKTEKPEQLDPLYGYFVSSKALRPFQHRLGWHPSYSESICARFRTSSATLLSRCGIHVLSASFGAANRIGR